MSLGNLLLQPQRLQRETGGDPRLEVVQDVLRLLTLLAEDAADDGPLAGVMPELVTRLSQRIQSQAGSGVDSVRDALKAHFQPLFLYFEGLVDDIEALEANPTALIAIIRQLVAALRTLLDGITQAQIRTQLEFAKGLLEQRLGIDNQFVNNQLGALFDDLITLWQALPDDISPKRRRRRRLALQIVRRLRHHLTDRFTLPEIDTARAAAQLYALLRSSGLRDIFAEIHCTLDRFDEALGAVDEIRAALPLNLGGGSAGAALIEPEGAARYCWYASWLLSDIDLPLLGIGDLENKQAFANMFRTHVAGSNKANAVTRYLFSTMTEAQQNSVLAYDGTSEPDEMLIRTLVGHINRQMQIGPIFTYERFSTFREGGPAQTPISVPFQYHLQESEAFEPSDWPEDLTKMRNDHDEDQELFLYNRRFIEWIYGSNVINTLKGGFQRYAHRKTIGVRRDVFISGDRRFLMCDDMPIHLFAEGVEPKWQDALLFVDKQSDNRPADGATWYSFRRVGADACDILAQVVYGLEQTARPIWHLVELQPGHEAGTGIVSGLDILHALSELLFGKPISGYESIGKWGPWLMHDYIGPRGLFLTGFSLQGLHTEATPGNGWWFWVTVILGDFMRVLGTNSTYLQLPGHNGTLRTIRDGILSFFTLLNASSSNSGDSSLPRNPAANHLKQEGLIIPTHLLFAYLLMLNYKRENHSIEIWSAGDIGDQRGEAFGLWFGGGIGFGILAGLAGSIVTQFIAWQEDWELLGWTILEGMAVQVLDFWFFEYRFKEGDTADGTYGRVRAYKGYPAQANSPYRLPFANGSALYMGQGNNGLFSHNVISNMGNRDQHYSFDFGHDHREQVLAMRGGTIVDYNDGFADNNDQDPNFIVIRHDTQVDDHDDPFGTGNITTYARYLHGAQSGVINIFGPDPTGTTHRGTVVAQGDPIMEADDTGTSFHSHLHVYVLMDDGGNPGQESIPFVFEDVDSNAGLPEKRTWYRAGD